MPFIFQLIRALKSTRGSSCFLNSISPSIIATSNPCYVSLNSHRLFTSRSNDNNSYREDRKPMSRNATMNTNVPVNQNRTNESVKQSPQQPLDESKQHQQQNQQQSLQSNQNNQLQSRDQSLQERPRGGFLDSTSWLSDFFENPFTFGMARQPISVDLISRPNEIVLRAECPGIRKDDIKVSVDNDTLTVSGERHNEQNEQTENYIRRECSYGAVSRSVRLPQDAIVDKINASYENGILNVSVPRKPKTEQQSRSRQIQIQ